MTGSSHPGRTQRLPQYPSQDVSTLPQQPDQHRHQHQPQHQQPHPYPPARHDPPHTTHRHHPYRDTHRTTLQPQISLHHSHSYSQHQHLPRTQPPQRYHQPRHVSHPARPSEAPISGGSVFGQINLLADVATREVEGQHQRSTVGGWAPNKPSAQTRTEARRLPPLLHSSSSASSSSAQSPTAAARHPLSDLTLDKEYAPYDPGKLQADVRRMLHAPTISTPNPTPTPPPPPPAPPGPLPQWPASQGQAHGKVITDNGRTWVTLERPRAPGATPAATASSTTLSADSQPHVSPKSCTPAYSLPTPPISSRLRCRETVSTAPSVDVKSETQEASAIRDTGEWEDSDDADSDSADGYVPSSPRVCPKVGWPSRTLRSSTRAHSSSLSSTASAPLPSNNAPSPNAVLRPRAGTHPADQNVRCNSISSTQPKRRGTKRKAARRDGERRREQNAVAQKKFRYKKKMIEQQMVYELEESRAQMAVLLEELAKVKAESEAEIARLKAENDALRA